SVSIDLDRPRDRLGPYQVAMAIELLDAPVLRHDRVAIGQAVGVAGRTQVLDLEYRLSGGVDLAHEVLHADRQQGVAVGQAIDIVQIEDVLEFPDDLAVRVDLDGAITEAVGNQGVAVREAFDVV